MKIQPKYVMMAIIAVIVIIGDILLFTVDFNPRETGFLVALYVCLSALATFCACVIAAIGVISSNSWNPKDWD